jgi:hypothetical protein
MKITKAQKGAEKLVRDYLTNKRLGTEYVDACSDGIRIDVSHRFESDIYDELPCNEILKMMAEVVKDLRQLSPLVYVTQDTCDEWVNLTITIRDTRRKTRPADITNLTEKVIQGLPAHISAHPVVTGVHKRYYRCEQDGVEVRTNLPSPIGKRVAALTWELRGDSLQGWTLVTRWGVHKATRSAGFKKLTPKIILTELDRITAMLSDPMDCLGHVINVKNDDGAFALTGNRRDRQTFAEYTVLSQDKSLIQGQHHGKNILFTNNLTGAETLLRDGDVCPEHLKSIEI